MCNGLYAFASWHFVGPLLAHFMPCCPVIWRTKRLHCVEWHNTVFARSDPLSVHKLFTSCIGRCLVSRACDWVMSVLSAALLIFSFQFSLLFFHISVARQHKHCGILLVLICNIGHRTLPKIWVGTFPVRSVQGVSLLVNFRRCVIIAELWRPEVGRPGNFVSNFFRF